jgi:hypothetical protein
MRGRFLVALAGFVALAGSSAAAAPDPQTRDAYRWRVVLSPGKHPVLSAGFRDQLGREIRAALQGAAGPVAAVEVVDLAVIPPDEWEPLWKQFAEKGWAALEPELTRPLTGVKTHFLRIDYRDGQFYLEAKQHDGTTGLPTPVLRKQTVRSADMVARRAGMMLEPDFCPTGTVDFNPDAQDFVKVTLRGSAIGPLDRYVRLGGIFTVSIIREYQKPRGPRAENAGPVLKGFFGLPQEYTLLKVVEPIRDGAVRCQVLTRWQTPFGRDWKRVAAIRCLMLPTVDSPVRLRLVGRDGTPHARGTLLQVAATDSDFTAKPGPQDSFEFRDGLYRSGRPFGQVACVQITLGAGRPSVFPVPVLGADPVTIKFEIKPEDEERAIFEAVCTDLRGRVADAALAQKALAEEMNRLIDERKNKDALARAEAGHAGTETAIKALSDELKRTEEDPKAKQTVAAEILRQCGERLAQMAGFQVKLANRITDLKKVVAESKDPIRVLKEFKERDLAERIKECIARGDVDDALRAYDDLIVLRPTEQELKDQRERLLSEWTPKDEEHRKAREAFKAWTQAKTAAEYKEAAGPMGSAAEVFYRKQDKHGLRKLLNLLEPAQAALKALTEKADSNTEDGAQALKDIEAVHKQVREIDENARALLKKLTDK